jgi:imidazole glycerol-phosphate synthase subunit HisH
MIGIIDYGAGNLLSVYKALKFLKVEPKILSKPEEFDGIDKLILPGVGAFQSAMKKLLNSGMSGKTLEWLENDKPFLGICLGMQLLFESSEEAEAGFKGLCFLKGSVPKFQTDKVPQIGWNNVTYPRESNLFRDIKSGSSFYFLHSYYIKPEDEKTGIGSTDYEISYTSAINKGNIYGVQFHPEKSGKNGLKLLQNWIELC